MLESARKGRSIGPARIAVLLRWGVVAACMSLGCEQLLGTNDFGTKEAGHGGAGGAPPHLEADCLAVKEQSPRAPSGMYDIAVGGAQLSVYCDMETDGGGWTRVSPAIDASAVDALRGGAIPGNQMLKCSNSSTAHIISPSFNNPWSWGSIVVTKVGGDWIVNGATHECGTEPEFDDTGCETWWGIGCSNGAGPNNKLYPGLLATTSGGYCIAATTGFASGALDICGDENYSGWAVFVRSSR